MRAWRNALALLLAFGLALGTALAFDATVVDQAERALTDLRASLDLIAAEVQNPAFTDEELSARRRALEDIRTRARAEADKLAAPLAEVTQQIASLGPAPGADKTEPESVAAERKTLQGAIDLIQGVKTRLGVLAVEAEQQAGRVSALQRSHFFQRISERDRSIFHPLLWLDVGLGLSLLASRVGNLLVTWWSDTGTTANPLGLGLIPLFLVLFFTGYRTIRSRLERLTESQGGAERKPDDFGRLWRIVQSLVGAAAALFILFMPIYLALELSGYLTARFAIVLNATVDLIAGTTLYWTLLRGVMSPGRPEWRIVDIDDSSARRATLLGGLTAFLSIANEKHVEISDALFLPVSHTIGISAFSALSMLALEALILVLLKGRPAGEQEPGRRYYFTWAKGLAPLAWLVVAAGFGALAIGYLAFANYLSQQLFQTAVVIAALFLLHYIADATVAASFDPESGFGRFVRRATNLGERAIERLGLLWRIAFDVVLLLAGLPLLLLLWTFTWVDFRGLLNTIFLGVRLGEVTISPASVLTVLAVLGAGIALTNLLVRWLDRRILREARLDRGVRDSIQKGASYTGYIVAVGLALSTAGFALSSLAILAGALGVGIGFGLQSIVNNFLSGLILLAERPIRVGDWVVLDAGQGIVKRINVRSTEIETFDSCSIIVPNLMLITGVVKNWTHSDTMGQFLVAVTVDLASDAETVRKLLFEAAREHDKVLTYPEPSVVLARIGPGGLDFELRGSVSDVLDAGGVASDLRFTLLGQFREKGITIPAPPALWQAPLK